MHKRLTLKSAVLVALGLVTSMTSWSQSFPAKPIRLICPFAPAGAVDIASRAIAHEMSKQLGVSVTVENKSGAGGNIGGAEVVRSAPDGYTILMTTSGIEAINPSLYARMPFDTVKDLTPISVLVSLNNVLVVHPSVKARTVNEFIALGQNTAVTVGSAGNGTSIHMSAEMFKHLTHFNMTHVPYKGSGPAMSDLLGGQVQAMFDNIPSALPHIKSGKLRAIATTGAKRDPTLPDLPTIAEAGVKGYASSVWLGLAAPAGTPPEVIAKLNAAAVQGTKSADFVKRMSELGYNILGTTPAEMAEMTRAEMTRWTPIVKASGARAD
jgi:tripartite-type tricarboxylate transporter receptor subunit TctC